MRRTTACLVGRSARRGVGVAVLSGVICGAMPHAGRAQTPVDRGGDFTAMIVDSIRKAAEQKTPRVVGAKQVVIDPTTHAARVLLRNPGSDTVVVEVSLQFAPLAQYKPMLADALLTEDAATVDSLAKEEERVAKLGARWSLASWLKEPLPLQLWLKPRQTVELALHFAVPDTVAPGEYSAYLVVRPMHISKVRMSFGGLGSASMASGEVNFINPASELAAPPSSVQLQYRVGKAVD